jgi:hypothetical protein
LGPKFKGFWFSPWGWTTAENLELVSASLLLPEWSEVIVLSSLHAEVLGEDLSFRDSS